MDTKELLNGINTVYWRLETKQTELVHALSHRIFEIESGWYNGHYHRGDDGEWRRESYPIPVIGVKGFCDIEIHFDRVTVSTKLRRGAALAYPYEKMAGYRFEAYGVEDYLADYYHEGQSLNELKENIRSCDEAEIGFSFLVPFETDSREVFELVKWLRREGFYY